MFFFFFLTFLFLTFLDHPARTLSMLWARSMIQMKKKLLQNNSNPVTRPPWTWQCTTQSGLLSVPPSLLLHPQRTFNSILGLLLHLNRHLRLPNSGRD